jgi:hypothetical protein
VENKKLRTEQGITEGNYHYDIPYTVEKQTSMLKKAGFISVEKIGQYRNTVILVARKNRYTVIPGSTFASLSINPATVIISPLCHSEGVQRP